MNRQFKAFLLGSLLMILGVAAALSQSTEGTVIFPPQPVRRFDQAPPPERYIQPGIEGVYQQLRTFEGSGYKEVPLQPYEPYHSPVTPADPALFHIRQIVVKFVEGSGVRLREGNLVVSQEPGATETRSRLGRMGLEPAMVAADLKLFNQDVAATQGFADRSAPDVDELDLQRLRQAAERSSRFEQPDLNLFYYVYLPEMAPEEAQRVLQRLQRYRSVEVAYFQPIPFDAADKSPTTTLNVFPSQDYLRAAPLGIDVDFARNFTGGLGQGVRIVDIEAGWNIGHEDLPSLFFRYGTNFGGDHGTAVLGQLVAEDNGFGATGISPLALAGWSSVSGIKWWTGQVYFYSVANALLESLNGLRAGDIALIEQHFPSNVGPQVGACNPLQVDPQFGFVAVETLPLEHAAISHLTGAGVIVVEAAGNGQQLVTPASTRDSGAIVVGASNGAPPGSATGSQAPACFTNFGPRVDVQAWGGNVGTLSYGTTGCGVRLDAAGNPVLDMNGNPICDPLPDPTLRANGTDPDQWYTRTFSGTSSASPIVAGAAALVQGIRIAAGQAPLTSVEMRTLLASTGTPQTPAARNIGPQPDLRAAIASMFPDHARFTSQSGPPASPLMPGAPFNITVSFQNAGGISWTGGHSVQIAPTQTGPSAFGTQSIALGSPSAPIDPNGLATTTFTLRAPATAGTYPLSFWVRAPNGSVLAQSPSQQIIVGAPPSDTGTLAVVKAPAALPMGVAGDVWVVATNTGATVWTPQTHALRIWTPSQSLTLTHFAIPVGPPVVAPGQTFTFYFQVTCRTSGQNQGYSSQMNAATTVSPVLVQTVLCK